MVNGIVSLISLSEFSLVMYKNARDFCVLTLYLMAMLNNNDENRHPCLIPDFRVNTFSFFTIEDNICCGFIIYAFYYVEVYSSCTYFLKSLYYKWVLSFVKGFLYFYWDGHMVFIFQFVIRCITLIDLQTLKNLCITGIRSTWSRCVISLMCSSILFASMVLRNFTFMFISDIGL